MAAELPVAAIFFVVYAGMILGGLPFLQLDRTGVALLGAIAMVSIGALTLDEALAAIHAPTLILLFAFMVISAQLRLGGFYTWVTYRLGAMPLSPAVFLGALTFVTAALSAVFSNDVICLAVAPVLIEVCRARRLNPVPFLLALACAANIGSAATLIGNPQNMLIGATLQLSFAGYLQIALVPVVVGLFAMWALIVLQVHGRWPAGGLSADTARHPTDTPPPFDVWQSVKGLAVAGAVFVLFLTTSLPREVVALIGAGLLMTSRKLHSQKMLGLVDWQLLVLFIGLFIVNQALQKAGLPQETMSELAAASMDVSHPAYLFLTAFSLSNIVSNVPAVMLLLPAAVHELAGPLLALSSTLAGNLFIVGSIANIIVVDAAAKRGVVIDWRSHARIGVPVTLITGAIAAGWLWWYAERAAA
jgi:Na+/H+ antiporter NhaD/arsenite permease-like protein